jgi:hypothetical protein
VPRARASTALSALTTSRAANVPSGLRATYTSRSTLGLITMSSSGGKTTGAMMSGSIAPPAAPSGAGAAVWGLAPGSSASNVTVMS